MDLFDHKIIGYSYGLNMNDDLSIDALKKALANRPISKECICHSNKELNILQIDMKHYLKKTVYNIHILKKVAHMIM